MEWAEALTLILADPSTRAQRALGRDDKKEATPLARSGWQRNEGQLDVDVIPSERSEPRDPFDSAFGLAQDKPVGKSVSALLKRSIGPSTSASLRDASARDDKSGAICWFVRDDDNGYPLMSDSRPRPNKRVRLSLWCGRPARTSSAAVESCRRDACTTITSRRRQGINSWSDGKFEIRNPKFPGVGGSSKFRHSSMKFSLRSADCRPRFIDFSDTRDPVW